VRKFLIAILCAGTPLYGAVVSVSDPTALNTTDVVNWSQLGTSAGRSFSVFSSNFDYVTGQLGSGPGTVVKAGASTTGWQADGGIDANDALLLTGTSGSSSDSVTLSTSPVYGLGAYLDAGGLGGAAGTQFSASLQVFAGTTSVLDTTITSDATGDPVFLGVTDPTQEITRVIFSLTNASGTPIAGTFILDSLYLQTTYQAQVVAPLDGTPIQTDQPVPEPGMASLFSSGILALVFAVRKRYTRI